MNLLETAIQASLKAGKAILAIYARDFEVETKADKSPLTEADKNANAIILDYLKPTGIPIISEEIKALPFEARSGWKSCWIVDPLDGTKEFVKRNGEFTVNIALSQNGVPVLGVVFVPVTGKLYFADKEWGTFSLTIDANEEMPSLEQLKKRGERLWQPSLPETFTVVASRSHLSEETEVFINKCKEKYGEVAMVSCGSSIKLCMVAEGKAHVYPRIAPTMEWDTAAAHAVAKYAGCKVLGFSTGKELAYNKRDLLNPYFIVSRRGESIK